MTQTPIQTLVTQCALAHDTDIDAIFPPPPVTATHWLATNGCILGLCDSHYETVHQTLKKETAPIQVSLIFHDTVQFQVVPPTAPSNSAERI
jgi:hypothetical protein